MMRNKKLSVIYSTPIDWPNVSRLIASSMAANLGSSVEVTSRTDNVGNQASNNDISEFRLNAGVSVSKDET